ncbi:hypothetical protein AOLI_G00289410 [Acnodon oligacanthus]
MWTVTDRKIRSPLISVMGTCGEIQASALYAPTILFVDHYKPQNWIIDGKVAPRDAGVGMPHGALYAAPQDQQGQSGGHLSELRPLALKVEGGQGRSKVNRFYPKVVQEEIEERTGWRQAGATVKEGESDLHGAGPIRRSGGIDREGPLEEAASPQPHRGGQHTQPHRDTDGPCVCECGPRQIYSHESAVDSRAGAKERQYGGRGGGPAQDPPPKKPFHIRIVSAFFPW